MQLFHHTDPIESASPDNTLHRRDRQLAGGNNGEYQGNAFNALPAASLSWRYLGMFIDDNCDGNNRRNLWYNYNNNYKNVCRKVLWAAYVDPEYEGEGIAEYSFYDRSTGTWDTSTCHPQTNGLYFPGSRCRRLDCHEAGTELELVGVFKETDGLYDFTEQLFKHQGYCLWDADKETDDDDWQSSGTSDYEFMKKISEKWVRGCTQLYTVDWRGRTLYYDTKPLPGGDMTYGVYTDSSCTVESKVSWSHILSSSNDNQGNNGMPSIRSLERWNDLLSDFKICQPCRAYNRIQTSDPVGQYDAEEEEGEDGEGGKDPWGFNCYDDAGYQNCNQCYKFQSKTNMELASIEDLELATKQGTILGVEVDGISYGKGHYVARKSTVKKGFARFVKTVAFVTMLALCVKLFIARRERKRRRNGEPNIPSSKRERDVRQKTKKKKKHGKAVGNRDLGEAMLGHGKRDASPKRSRSRSQSRSKGRSNSSLSLQMSGII
ncbi:hypothetical protein HJC23_001001 [Cyclotella cryptica]|uniref:Uncharacterized protein n=1 Tax=Cyclotella cryptica TaxID=29204 RepID=A0ABD3P0P7_9STRA|eukprot:CCRYP_018470-RA/>CCRYP_018470-RA protein AED:0.09 eAED:0.09 QI:248/-1/1/1/-1/1/1/345/489